MNIKKYKQFESKESEDIFSLPLEARIEIKKSLEEIKKVKSESDIDSELDSDSVHESIMPEIGDFLKTLFGGAIKRLRRWLSKKMIDILINMNEKDLKEKIKNLRQLDPTDLSDIDSVEAIYLGGGIDKTSEEDAAGWRDKIEDFFGHERVVKGEDMIRLAKTGKINKAKYEKPLILNPLRNELVRQDDPKFAEIFQKWKKGELDKEKDHEEWKYWADIINKEIYAPDLRIVNICDTNLVKLDPAAGAGTISEMQISSLRGLNLFVWLDNGYTIKDISPWLIPSVTKLIRSKEELNILLEKIKIMNEKESVDPTPTLAIEKFENWKNLK